MQAIFLICFCLYFGIVNSSFCFWNSGCSYRHFATKTPYNLVRGDIRDSIIKVKGCEAVSIWSLYRYGKRYPSENYARLMEDALEIRNYIADSFENGKCSLCAQDVENLMNWKVDSNLFKGVTALTEEGYQEMFSISKRLKVAFPGLLKNLTASEFKFRPTPGDGVEDSAEAYIDGFGNGQLALDKINVDASITPFSSCEKYQNEVSANPKTYEEADKYQKSSEYLAMKDRIQRRAGVNLKLTNENVTALYDLCRHTSSGLHSKPSPWCALFTSEDLQILEYVEDLKQYYRNGYGTPMNERFGRIILADLFKSFQEAKAGDGKKITAFFSRSTALDMTLSSLGLFKDKDVLRGVRRNRERKWRSYKQSAFSSNIMAVLSKCNVNEKGDHTIIFYLNEEPIKSICLEGICPWKEFEEKMKPFLETSTSCKFDKIQEIAGI